MVTNNTSITVDENSSENHIVSFSIVALLSVSCSVMDLIPVIIILRSKRLCRAANYAVVSFLLGATIQAFVAAPFYLYRKIVTDSSQSRGWVCDVYRMAYFFSGHIMKISLLIVSYDRLCAIRNPFKYDTIFAKRNMFFIILLAWICVLSIDLVPFFTGKIDKELCTYIPVKLWGISVILIFNVMPFVLITRHYVLLWRIASRMALKDLKQEMSLKTRSTLNESNKNKECHEKCEVDTEDSFLFQKQELKKQRSYVEAVKKGLKNEETKNNDKPQLENNKEEQSKPLCNCSSFTNRRKMLRLTFELKATKTSFLLLFVYLICWGPLAVFYIIDHICSNCLSTDDGTAAARFYVKILCFMSSPMAPIIYCWRTREFRKEAIKLFCRKTYKRRRFESSSKSSMGQSQYSINMSVNKRKTSFSSLKSTIRL